MTVIKPYALMVEDDPALLGLDRAEPTFSWKLRGTGFQTAYRIEVWAAHAPGRRPSFDSGLVESDATVGVQCPTLQLTSHEAYRWRVTVRDGDGVLSRSARARFETGFLGGQGMTAAFITVPATPMSVPDAPVGARRLKPPRLLRRPFMLPGRPARARLYASAAGVYLPFLNGERVGDREMAPGWTDYGVRLRYQTYDVTPTLTSGENVLGFLLGDGWYAGHVGFGGRRARYGEDPALWAELHCWFSDGSRTVIVTGPDWTGSTGPILYSDLLMGEAYDARRARDDWCTPGAEPEGFEPAQLAEPPGGRLVADATPPVRVYEVREPVAITEPDPGVYVLDFGQNLAGRPCLDVGRVRGRLRLRFGEVLDRAGRLYTENLRGAAQTDIYQAPAAGSGVWRPAFTYHGFRYVEVSGLITDGPPPEGAVRVEVLASDEPEAGHVVAGDRLLRQLQDNIRWSQRSNLLFVPTDCPQRDERLGWLGDAQVFIETATWNQDVRRFFRDWLQSVRDAQSAAGAFSDVAPRIEELSEGAPGWADAGVRVPWTLYEMYGDRRLLADCYPSMRRYVDYIERQNPEGLWTTGRGNDFGDWLSVGGKTPKDLIASAFYADDARILSEAAVVLGERSDAVRFRALHARIRTAFLSAFVLPDGRVAGDTQTGYALALAFRLVPKALRGALAARLRENLAAHQNLLTTGFLGTPHLLPALSEAGADDLAWGLLRETRYPSWGYEIRHGATTVWERFDSWTEERGFQDPGMNSFNHFAFGSVGAWLYRYGAGIRPAVPGFRRVVIAPHLSPDPGSLGVRYESARGLLESTWRHDGRCALLCVLVPANVRAELHVPVPADAASSITVCGRPGRVEASSDGRQVFHLGPGRHTIRYPVIQPAPSRT